MARLVSLIAVLILAAPGSLAAQQESRPLCFGISFDRGCRVMIQYEAGGRVRAAGELPVGKEQRPYASSSRYDSFIGAGLMFPRGPRSAVGIVYQAGTEGPVHSLGVRYARSLGGRSRIDLTAGGAYIQRSLYSGGAPALRSTGAVFGEGALHASDYVTVLVREESFLPTRDIASRSRLMVGARLERGPAVVASAAAAALIGLVLLSFGGEDT